jgi:hypothetical protein
MPLVLVYLQRSLCPSLLQQFPQAVCLIDQKRVGGIMLVVQLTRSLAVTLYFSGPASITGNINLESFRPALARIQGTSGRGMRGHCRTVYSGSLSQTRVQDSSHPRAPPGGGGMGSGQLGFGSWA